MSDELEQKITQLFNKTFDDLRLKVVRICLQERNKAVKEAMATKKSKRFFSTWKTG